MSSNESTLRAVRAQVQFELAETASEVAEATTRSVSANRHVIALTDRCRAAANELSDVLSRPHVNPALLAAMRRLFQVERRSLQEWQTRLDTAEQREHLARIALADVRNRERALERALRAERCKRQRKQQTLDIIQADELWLQHSWRELS
jgi:hypothetical protein